MKAAVFHEHGSMKNIRWDDFPDPECGPDDVVIAIKAAALNGFDPMMVMKMTALRTPLPMIVAGDGAGEIVEVGTNVGNWSIGDRVTVYPLVAGEGMTGETRLGTCSEYHRIPGLQPGTDSGRLELRACGEPADCLCDSIAHDEGESAGQSG